MYIARGKVNGIDSIGRVSQFVENHEIHVRMADDHECKVSSSHKWCHLPYGGKEHQVGSYEVLIGSKSDYVCVDSVGADPEKEGHVKGEPKRKDSSSDSDEEEEEDEDPVIGVEDKKDEESDVESDTSW